MIIDSIVVLKIQASKPIFQLSIALSFEIQIVINTRTLFLFESWNTVKI